ncbi:uncharacterized protein LOC125572429 [Nematostella vectensis]|uniref:uncharacterized protein LOC125572429 n=1 Tax=Nematostella vectensis TaxID=45351 RepID=UPI0020771B45|nr:uncharacterized protein LOC125572429 [Nematostella vectensis]
MIVGSVVGAILVLAIVLGLFLCLWRKKEQARKDVESKNKPAKEVKVHYNSDECEALVSGNATREHAHEAAETPTLLPSHTYETTNDTWNTTSTSVNSETAIGLYSAIDNGVNDDVNPYASADHNPEITTSKDSIYASADSLASVQSTPGSHTYAQVDKTKKKKKCFDTNSTSEQGQQEVNLHSVLTPTGWRPSEQGQHEENLHSVLTPTAWRPSEQRQQELKFYGHICSSEGILADPEKIEAITDIGKLESVSEVEYRC